MPIYEFECALCGAIFETISLKIDVSTTTPCPNCNGMGQKLISAPAIIYEVFDERATHRLPDWDQQMTRAKAHDARMARHLKQPLSHDKGQGIKVYETDFGHNERRQLEQKAQLDNL